MPMDYCVVQAWLKYIAKYIFRSRIVRFLASLAIVKWALARLIEYAKRQQALEEEQERQEALKIDAECEEGQYNCGVPRTASSVNFYLCNLAPSMQMRHRRIREEERLKELQAKPYPPLEDLYFERKLQKDRLWKLKREVRRDVGRLEAEQYLLERMPRVLKGDRMNPKAAVEEAREDYAKGVAEQRRRLHDSAQDLRNRIYDECEGICKPKEEYAIDMPIEQSVKSLMRSLEFESKRVFVKQRGRLERRRDSEHLLELKMMRKPLRSSISISDSLKPMISIDSGYVSDPIEVKKIGEVQTC